MSTWIRFIRGSFNTGFNASNFAVANRPRSIYQYSNMAPRLSGKNCKFYKFLLSLNSQETWIQRKQHQI